VDNPLVKVCDPDFLGRHVAAGSEASSKVVFKEKPEEKVGVFAVVDGMCGIIEYSDLSAETAAERDAGGRLAFRAGSPAIHVFAVDFLRRVTARGGGLNFHLARKKVPYHDPATGRTVTPTAENALKFELFVFDALPLAGRWLLVETRREEEFAPLKNATGADSPETVFRLMTRLHAGWLERAGVDACGHPVEVSPLFALDADECGQKLPRGFEVSGPTLLR
jgi:UDP-N-acetylglucosamine/UDP-N-acetylgalactosamine diphosphorylase